MKKAIALAVFMATALSAWAQPAQSKVSLQLGGGSNMPTGDLRHGWGVGLGVGATINFNLAGGFTLFGDIRHSSFPIDARDWGLPDDASIDGGTLAITSFFAGAKYVFDLSGALSLYGLAGGGMGIISASDLTATFDHSSEHISFESSTKPGFAFGGGLVFHINPKVGVFGEIRLVTIFTEGSSTTFAPVFLGVIVRI